MTLTLALILVCCAVLAYGGTRALLPVLRRRAILDHPNERSSHQIPTPRGGGIAVVTILLIAWIVIGIHLGEGTFRIWALPIGASLLAIISWADDLTGLGPLVRLVAQAIAVSAILALGPEHGLIFQGLLPPDLDAIAAGILWVWFINLFNFMDGIDGITGVETVSIGVGLAVVVIMGGALENQATAFYGVAAAGAALGFLVLNWPPAKVFMGDVGSVPLGFLLGWLLLGLAADGQWAAALIIPSYYLTDATVTLFRRALRGEKIWRPHRQHFYQLAVQRGLDHQAVSLRVVSLNAALLILAALAQAGATKTALFIAALFNIAFLFRLARGAIS